MINKDFASYSGIDGICLLTTLIKVSSATLSPIAKAFNAFITLWIYVSVTLDVEG